MNLTCAFLSLYCLAATITYVVQACSIFPNHTCCSLHVFSLEASKAVDSDSQAPAHNLIDVRRQNLNMDQSNSTNALPTSLRILCFGDSLTAGYTMSGWSFFPYATELRVHLMRLLSLPESMITIEVEGLSGDQVRAQYQRRMQRKCASATNDPYDWIVIMGGTNDLVRASLL